MIRVCSPKGTKKTLGVKIISDDKLLNEVYLVNIVGTNLWQVSFNIPFYRQHIEFGVSFKFNSSVQLHIWKLGTVKFFEHNKELRTGINRFSVEHPLIIQLVLDENIEEEYCSHCLYILRSAAENGEELKCISEAKMLEKIACKLNQNQREEILRKTIQTMQKADNAIQIRRANSAVFLCFLSQMNIPTLQLQNILPMNLAEQVFLQCLSITCISNSIPDVFQTIENVYKCAFRGEPNFLSYCDYMYNFFGPKTSCEMLSKWKRGNQLTTLLPSNGDYSKQVIKSLVAKIFNSVNENCGISEEIDFLQVLQGSLTLELQIELIEDLESRKILPLDKQLEIFYSTYDKTVNELSRKGELVFIISQWNRVISCSVLSSDKLRRSTSKYLIDSYENTSDLQLNKACKSIQKLCVDGTLFTDAASKVQIMQKMATSLNEEFNSLLPVCLNEWTLQDISIDDVESIVLRWFDLVLKHYCKQSKRNKASSSLLRFYYKVDEISLHPLLRSESDLKRKLDRKTVQYLKEFEIIDIVNFVPEMTNLKNEPTEDMFRDHIRDLFKQGLQNEDLEKRNVFTHIRTREINSR